MEIAEAAQFHLRPAALLPQAPEPPPKPNANVFGHLSQHDGVLLIDDRATLSKNTRGETAENFMGFIPDSHSATVRIGARWRAGKLTALDGQPLPNI
jgi:hypothetical protein